MVNNVKRNMVKSTKKSEVPEWFRNIKPRKLPKWIIDELDDYCGPDKYGFIYRLRHSNLNQRETMDKTNEEMILVLGEVLNALNKRILVYNSDPHAVVKNGSFNTSPKDRQKIVAKLKMKINSLIEKVEPVEVVVED